MFKNRFLRRRVSGEHTQNDGISVSIHATRGMFFTRYDVEIEKRMCRVRINLGTMSGTRNQVIDLLTIIDDANIGFKTGEVITLVNDISRKIKDRTREV